jgi:16S rRNA (cytosine1402-N4)-methyltransferase
VNRELDEVDAFLSVSPALLGVDGRLAVISFHSLEDRRAKRALRNEARSREFEDILKGGVTAQSAELRENPRSRSARLRAIRRVEALS